MDATKIQIKNQTPSTTTSQTSQNKNPLRSHNQQTHKQTKIIQDTLTRWLSNHISIGTQKSYLSTIDSLLNSDTATTKGFL